MLPKSPFHSDNIQGHVTLQKNDEILLINGHRVKDPKRAAVMIKSVIGTLTITVSRGVRDKGFIYHLAKVDNTTTRGSKWQEEKKKGKEDNPNCCFGISMKCSKNNSLLRISSIQQNSPFVKSGLCVGDIILAVDGTAVKSVGDAEILLNSDIRDDAHDGKRSSNSRVVTLLIYSFWEMRHKVLDEELKLDSTDNSNNGDSIGKQLWQASYSYEKPSEHKENKEQEKKGQQKEYVVLRIPNTTVTFQLDFDPVGICSCESPYKAMDSFPSGLNHNEVNSDDEDDSSDEASKLSKDEARAALELVYQKHISPAIDALANNLTCRQV